MTQIETNIYTIENLESLNCKYHIYHVRGLSPDSEDFYKNTQFLADKLGRITKSPCVVFRTEEGAFIAQLEGYADLPDTFDLVGVTVKIEKEPKLKELNFNSLDSRTSIMAKKFLQFAINGHLYDYPSLWLPRAGATFYHKAPDKNFRSDKVDLYRGFALRVVTLKNGKIGICVDTKSKYIDKYPLPTHITRDEFREKYKGARCLYQYGTHWYEIRLEALNDLTVDEVRHPDGCSLFDDVHSKAGKVKLPNLIALPKNCSVLVYYTSKGEQRNVPSGLCKLTYGTEHPDVRVYHQRTIKAPSAKRQEIRFVVDRYLRDLSFGHSKVVLSQNPLVLDAKKFNIPDLEFGNSKVLSVQGSANSITSSLDDFGRRKKDLLYSNEAGLFVKKPFDRQYLILPQSIYESSGRKFLEDIKRELQQLNPSGNGPPYSPIVIPYSDSVQKSVHNLGREIINAADRNNLEAGFGIVMIPELPSRVLRKEDELANLVMRELRKRGVYVTVIHTKTLEESYEHRTSDSGSEELSLVSDHKQRGVYKGYVKNVVLNKILLLNHYWPFVLKNPLNADLTIGIDVKNNMAGFTLIYKSGAEIRFFSSISDQKEQLSRAHIRSKIEEILREEREILRKKDTENITIHRQGKLFPLEKEGILDALKTVAEENIISKDYQCTFVDVRKTSGVSLRLFEIVSRLGAQQKIIRNPVVGTYVILSDNDGFVCNTGYPFRRKGTARPLHIIKIDGEMPLESIIQDIFYLSNLTWTKIDDCARDPLTIKMTDIRLREIAGEYDKDALKFGEEEGGKDE